MYSLSAITRDVLHPYDLVEYSKGLLTRYGVRDKTDESLAEELPATEAVAWLDGLVYDAVAKNLGRHDLRKLLSSGATATALVAALEDLTGEGCELVGTHQDGDTLPMICFANGRDAGFERETAEGRRVARDLIRSLRESLGTNPLPTSWATPSTEGERQ